MSAPAPVQATLRLEGIHKSYGSGTRHETEVLHGIDLSLARGEFAALIGPSGSGKSTLLNIIGLLDKPSTGKLFLTGQEAQNLADKALTLLRAQAIGFVFQFHNLLPAFTAVENVMLPLLAARGRPDAAMRKWAEELIDKVGLNPSDVFEPKRDVKLPAGASVGLQDQGCGMSLALHPGCRTQPKLKTTPLVGNLTPRRGRRAHCPLRPWLIKYAQS